MAAPPASTPPPGPPAGSPPPGSQPLGPALQAAQALTLWPRVLVVGLNRSLPDLTPRQFALFLEVYLAPPPHPLRGLATTLNTSHPAFPRPAPRQAKTDFGRRQA